MRSPPRLNIRRGRGQMAELPALPHCLSQSGVGGLDRPLEHMVVCDERGCPPQNVDGRHPMLVVAPCHRQQVRQLMGKASPRTYGFTHTDAPS